jgi:hypothetical protein
LFSTLYLFSGTLLARLYIGHITLFFALAWLPLFYYCAFRILHKYDCSLSASALLAVISAAIYFAGGFYLFIFIFVILLIYALSRMALTADRILLARSLCIATGLTFLLIAIEAVPGIHFLSQVVRIDPINPLQGGGSLDSTLAAFMFGTPVGEAWWGAHESAALVGALVVVLMILGLLFQNRRFAYPSLFALGFAAVWADGGGTLLSFVHLLPVLDTFRCPGRIYGAVLPIVLVLAACGFRRLLDGLRNSDGILLTTRQKRCLGLVAGCGLVVLLFEIPSRLGSIIQPELPVLPAVFSLLIVLVAFFLLLFDRFRGLTLAVYLIGVFVLNSAVIMTGFPLIQSAVFIPAAVISLLVLFIVLAFRDEIPGNTGTGVLILTLVLTILLCIFANTATLQPSSLGTKPSLYIVNTIRYHVPEKSQVWVDDRRIPATSIDAAYWYIRNGMHVSWPYYAYYPENPVKSGITLGNETYRTWDAIVDYSDKSEGRYEYPDGTELVRDRVSILFPHRVLPGAFIFRNGTVIAPAIPLYSAGHVRIEGDFQPGDIAVLKTACYQGWYVNGASAEPYEGFVAGHLSEATGRVDFTFDPPDYRLGVVMTSAGIMLVTGILLNDRVRRRSLNNRR